MSPTFFSLLSVGFGLGLLHALDADHVMAISTLNNTRPSLLRTLRFCLSWVVGHSSVLLLSVGLLIGLGVAIPPQLQYVSEMAVGALLIILGAWCFWRFRQDKLILVEHTHGKLVHRHWQKQGQEALNQHQSKKTTDAHTPAMVGVLHGLAGSAPALALIPTMSQGNLTFAISYMLIFSLGVMLAMLSFGLGWGALQRLLSQRYHRVFFWNQRLIAAGSMVVGVYWLSQAV
ncbi:MAG: sulfite exporter TauE/SafE family protein [Spongiibacteraceae bacterium]|nr:sulfite exporter TauE/SafE family protein [Spongiibacteraceae bacterium]